MLVYAVYCYMSYMHREESESVLLNPRVDRIFDIMSTRHRRLILLLVKRETIHTVNDVVARATGDSDALEIQLTHNHLPKLADEGYIEWDRDTGEISKGPRFDEIEPLLELIENYTDGIPPDWP